MLFPVYFMTFIFSGKVGYYQFKFKYSKKRFFDLEWEDKSFDHINKILKKVFKSDTVCMLCKLEHKKMFYELQNTIKSYDFNYSTSLLGNVSKSI